MITDFQHLENQTKRELFSPKEHDLDVGSRFSGWGGPLKMIDESYKVIHSYAAKKDCGRAAVWKELRVHPPLALAAKRIKSGHYIAHTAAYWPSRQPTGALEPPVIPGCNLCLHDITNLPPAKSSFNLEEHTLLFCGGVTRPLGGPDHLIAPPGPIHQTMGWVKGHRRESNPCT